MSYVGNREDSLPLQLIIGIDSTIDSFIRVSDNKLLQKMSKSCRHLLLLREGNYNLRKGDAGQSLKCHINFIRLHSALAIEIKKEKKFERPPCMAKGIRDHI